MPPLDLKGKSQAGSGLPAGRRRGSAASRRPGLAAPLVGRERELAAAARRLRRARSPSARCELLTIVGARRHRQVPAGQRLRGTRCAARPRSSAGRCLSYGEGLTFWPLREVVAELAGTDDGESADDGAGPDRAPAARRRRHGHDRRARGRRARAVGLRRRTRRRPSGPCASCWRRSRAERPLVVVLEDIHWAEPTFLDLIEHLAARSRGVPVLIVARRPHATCSTPGPSFGGRCRRHAAGARAAQRRRQPARSSSTWSATPAWPPTSPQRVFAARRGQPAVRRGARAHARRRASARAATSRASLACASRRRSRVPPTIHALLAARLDRLDPAERADGRGRARWSDARSAAAPSSS